MSYAHRLAEHIIIRSPSVNQRESEGAKRRTEKKDVGDKYGEEMKWKDGKLT